MEEVNSSPPFSSVTDEFCNLSHVYLHDLVLPFELKIMQVVSLCSASYVEHRFNLPPHPHPHTP